MAKQKPSPLELTPKDIFKKLNTYVIGQEKAKRAIAVAAYSHIKRISNLKLKKSTIVKKSNLLMIGPTGCGKTHIARNLAEILHLPITIADATEYSEAGYYGKDVEVMIAELLHKANGSVELAEIGIVFIDEIDKIARKGDAARTGAGSRDIGGEGVQQALLRILEGRKMFVPMNVTQHWNKHDFVEIDTSNILFICAGTFSDLRGEKTANKGGFNRPVSKPAAKKITTESLTKHGMIPELIGRLPILVKMEELSCEELSKIITVPPDSLVNQYREVMAADNVELNFDKKSLKMIVELAVKRKVGARGLRGIMEEVMHDYLFDLPNWRGKSLTITEGDVARILDE